MDTEPFAASAETSTVNAILTVDFSEFVFCANDGAGEAVTLTGEVHQLFHVTVNKNRFLFVTGENLSSVSGTGEISGDRYVLTAAAREIIGGSIEPGAFEDTAVLSYKVVGQGNDNNLVLHVTIHVTLNANGELTSEVLKSSVECT